MNCDIILGDFKSGVDFENGVVEIFNDMGIKAAKTGANDNGVDIVAVVTYKSVEYKYYIQCKYYNTTLGKHPVQEIYTGAKYYEPTAGKGTPVVITNNRVTREARVFAKQLGVEIIGDAEWRELERIREVGKNENPNQHKGLFGVIVGRFIRNPDYIGSAICDTKQDEPLTDPEREILHVQTEFDEAEEHIKESARLFQRLSQHQQKALNIQRDAIIRFLKYG